MTQTVPTKVTGKQLAEMLKADSVQAQFKNALGKHSDAFVASIVDLFNSDNNLSNCTPQSIVKECLKAATLQLPINKALGFAYILPFGQTPTFVIGYKGLIQLAMRTGQYKNINADVVYEGELKKGNKLTGEISLDGEKTSDKIVGYFAHFELLNGFSKTLYMSVEEMARYAKKYSPSVGKSITVDFLIGLANKGTSESRATGWVGNFNDMALKTCTRRLLGKYGFLSVEMINAISTEMDAEDSAMQNREDIQEGAASKDLPIEEAEVVVEQPSKQEQKAQAAPAF